MKLAFTILHIQCPEILLANLGGDRKYEANNRDQDVIVILDLIKGVMF